MELGLVVMPRTPFPSVEKPNVPVPAKVPPSTPTLSWPPSEDWSKPSTPAVPYLSVKLGLDVWPTAPAWTLEKPNMPKPVCEKPSNPALKFSGPIWGDVSTPLTPALMRSAAECVLDAIVTPPRPESWRAVPWIALPGPRLMASMHGLDEVHWVCVAGDDA